jgi:DHA1 family bicyclomycin/chloramphenicol resistance-like MFS transporter
LTTLLVGLSTSNTFAFNIFLPAMPGLVQSFATTPASVQLTVSLYIATFAVAQLAYGPLSDRFGRRRVLLSGLAIYTLAPILCAMAPTVESLAAARALQAVGGCAGLLFARVIARDLHERDRAAGVIGFITMMSALASAGIPAIGGWLDAWYGWQASFWVVTVVGAALFAAAWLWLPETRPEPSGPDPAPGFRGSLLLLRSPAYLGYALHGACTLSAWYAMVAGLPYVMVNALGQPSTAYGLYYPLLAFGYMAGNFLTARYAHRVGADRLIVRGAGIAIASCAVMYPWAMAGPTPIALFAPMAVIVLGHGLSQPSATSGALSVRLDLAGSAAGMMGFGQWLIAAGTTQLVGLVQDGTVYPVLAIVTTFTVLSMASYGLARWGTARQSSN